MRARFPISVIVWIACARVAAAEPDDATAAIRRAHDSFKQILARDAPAGSREAREVDEALARELRALFDVRALAEKASGAHWNKMTEAQRTRLAELLEQVVHRAQIKTMREYASYPVVYEGQSEDQGATRVKTVVQAKEGGRPVDIHVDYLVTRTSSGWRVWDLVTDGVSLLKTYRSQFHRIIAKEGVDGLIAKLQKKVERE